VSHAPKPPFGNGGGTAWQATPVTEQGSFFVDSLGSSRLATTAPLSRFAAGPIGRS
jgi:hypothetical protein